MWLKLLCTTVLHPYTHRNIRSAQAERTIYVLLKVCSHLFCNKASDIRGVAIFVSSFIPVSKFSRLDCHVGSKRLGSKEVSDDMTSYQVLLKIPPPTHTHTRARAPARGRHVHMLYISCAICFTAGFPILFSCILFVLWLALQ